MGADSPFSAEDDRYRSLFEDAPVGLYRMTPRGRLVMANRALLRMLGLGEDMRLQAEDIRREAFEPTFPQSDFKLQMDLHGRVAGLEAPWIRFDNTLIFVRENARAVRRPGEAAACWEGVVEEVTDQKRAHQALAQERQRLRTLIDHLPAGVILLDAQCRITVANDLARTALSALSPATEGELLERLGDLDLRALGPDERAKPLDFRVSTQGPAARVFSVTCRPVRLQNATAGHAMIIRELEEPGPA